jgi:hypothetical protein
MSVRRCRRALIAAVILVVAFAFTPSATAADSIAVSPTAGPVGSAVVISGTGCSAPNTSTVQLVFGGGQGETTGTVGSVQLPPVQAAADGSFSVAFTIPTTLETIQGQGGGTVVPGDYPITSLPVACRTTFTVTKVPQTCADTLHASSQAILVGEAPTSVPVDPPDTVSLLSGEVPPGLHLAADGTWTGTAQRAGTYVAHLRVGAPDAQCADQLDLTITVRSALARTGTSTAPLVALGLLLIASGVAAREMATRRRALR